MWKRIFNALKLSWHICNILTLFFIIFAWILSFDALKTKHKFKLLHRAMIFFRYFLPIRFTFKKLLKEGFPMLSLQKIVKNFFGSLVLKIHEYKTLWLEWNYFFLWKPAWGCSSLRWDFLRILDFQITFWMFF